MKKQDYQNEIVLPPNVKYKSSVFSKLFGDPVILRELYSAIEGVDLPADIEINITTLSNALIKGKLNDVSFLLGNRLIVLIEHQSTINENMPFRLLEYIDRSYKGLVNSKEILQRKPVKIPRPEFIVLYNGTEPYPDRKELRLSDAYKDTEGLKAAGNNGPSLELIVQVYNINYGHNAEILKKSITLDSYSIFIMKIREYENEGFDLAKALKLAVEYCIKNKILEDFFRKYGTEVIGMFLEEYTYENIMEAEREAARDEGLEEGREERNIEIARNMKNANESIEKIILFTGLSLEEVNNL